MADNAQQPEVRQDGKMPAPRDTLRATFLVDDKLRLYRGARCKLPTGEVVEVTNRRVPFYDLARTLAEMGYGDWHLQVYTPQGTPSLSGLVGKMAGLTVTERDKDGLRLEKYRPFPSHGLLAERDLGPEATQTPEKGETRVSDSPGQEEAA